MSTPSPVGRFARLGRDAVNEGRERSSDPWAAHLAGARWIGVANADTWLLSAPVEGYRFDPAESAWTGPPGIAGPAANTAVDFAGGPWAMVSLPLPADDDAARRLLLHEAWHAFGQPAVLPGLNASERPNPGKDLLDRGEARIWLRVHLAALAAALRTDGAERRRHAALAIAFRRRMVQGAHSEEIERQRCLELAEGLAEYVGWFATGAAARQVAEHVAAADPARSLVRSFAYRTGVGLGYLLDDLQPGWHDLPLSTAELPELLGESLEVPEPSTVVAEDYGYAGIGDQEAARDREQDAVRARYRRRYLDGPVLRLPLAAGRFAFDPHGTMPVPEGTLYTPFRWSSPDGARIEAPGGALVLADWSAFDLPLDDLDLPAGSGLNISTDGWKAHLPQTWAIEHGERGMLAQPPAGAETQLH